MIHYNIDTTENGYNNFTGDVESLTELKRILIKNDVVPNLVGYLSVNDISICIAAERGLGFFIEITDGKDMYLSLWDKGTLSEVIDVWGDGLYISKGLFIPVSLAWKGLEEYIIHNRLCTEINWITPDDIPEDGNYIC